MPSRAPSHAITSKKKLYGLALRMTGCSADAEDVVQETWVRYLSSPPEDRADPEPWLVTVTLNLARDRLRRRRREGYLGPWLPSPIDPRLVEPEPPSPDDTSAEARYSRLESVSFAFLLALEALTPMQRAVLLMRDVLDTSSKETAAALGTSESAVKVHLFRARKKLAGYERGRATVSPGAAADKLVRFLTALRDEDVEGMKGLLAEDAVCLTDGGGVVHASVVPLRGALRISSALLAIRQNGPEVLRAELAWLGGMAFVVGEQNPRNDHEARLFAMGCDLDRDGKIVRLYSVVSPRKIARTEAILSSWHPYAAGAPTVDSSALLG